MKDYVEEYKYNNCFWKKTGVLYEHSDKKFKEYISIGKIFKMMSDGLFQLSKNFGELNKEYFKPNEPNYTREDGIQVILSSIKTIKNEFQKLAISLAELSRKILEKRETYESKKDAMKMCDDAYKSYDNELKKLESTKTSYFDAMNRVVESFLYQKYGKKNNKSKQDYNKQLKNLEKKKEEYKTIIDSVEKLRAEYMEEQGNILAVKEELERDCTDELKSYFKSYIKSLEEFMKNFKLTEKEIKAIESINGKSDTERFAEANKSLITSPKRNMYKEYAVDLNYYMENFEVVKSKLKGKSPKEQREFQKELSTEITKLLSDIIKEEPDEINQRIEQIAKDIKENRLSKKDFEYLINKFQQRFDEFLKWKEEKVGNQEYRKVGKEWDERFCYMHTFLKYFNKKRVENKELNPENFNYLCDAVKKILELNENEDIDYNLCDLVVILSSTFYTVDKTKESGKKYVNEVVRNSSIMQGQGFWVGLTRHELNEEIQKQNKIEDTLKENDITEEKLNNSVIAKLMSVSYNIMQFVLDSNLFNRIIADVFKYCKINEQNRKIVVDMMESQILGENIDYLKLDKKMLLSMNTKKEKKEEEKKEEEKKEEEKKEEEKKVEEKKEGKKKEEEKKEGEKKEEEKKEENDIKEEENKIDGFIIIDKEEENTIEEEKKDGEQENKINEEKKDE